MTEELSQANEPDVILPGTPPPAGYEFTEHELYIQIRDGQPHEHPIFADNFRTAFPDIDPENLPADRFAKFIRVQPPVPGTYETLQETYEWVDGVVKDKWVLSPMSDEEREAKHDEMVAQAYATRDMHVAHCQEMMVQVTDPTGNQIWRETLAEFLTWQLETVDPVTPEFPKYPFRNPKGEWRRPKKQGE